MNTIFQVIQSYLAASELTNCNLSLEEWKNIMQIASEQKILPLVYDTVCHDSSFKAYEQNMTKNYREQALLSSIRQITQTNEFLTLLLHAQKQGLDPVVLKGVICRDLYPKSMLRPSVDEDLLISAEDTEKYHRFLLSEGLFCDTTNTDNYLTASFSKTELEKVNELSYHKENSPIYIELHKTLFDPQSEAYGDFNYFFPNLFEGTVHTMRVQIEDVSVRTLAPTEHLLYMFLHAFKHFIHSGIGIRPICDIGMFAEYYSNEIDWNRIKVSLEKTNAYYYCKALLRIIQIHLLPNAKFFQIVENWNLEEIDITPLLEDILASGIHGASSVARLHSSNMTLHAVVNQRNHSASDSLRATLFPPIKKMDSKYPYLKKIPLLLPFAWLQRGLCYITENKKANTVNNAVTSLHLGKQRIKLLEHYHIIINTNKSNE